MATRAPGAPINLFGRAMHILADSCRFMPSPSSTSGIRDNHFCGSVADYLRPHLNPGAKLAVVSAYFTIYAYEALKAHLDQIEHMDFLFGEPTFVKSLDSEKTQKKEFIIDADGLKLANTLQQKRVAKECADWIRRKVDIKSVKQTNFLHGKLYHIRNGEADAAILGSSNFTTRGLGLQTTGSNIELNLVVDAAPQRDELKAWFTDCCAARAAPLDGGGLRGN